MGKRKVISEQDNEVMHIPQDEEVFGITEKLFGYDRILVKCQDGMTRNCRIKGSMKRKVWIRVNDIVVVSPWDFQANTRGDVVWRYKSNQVEWLRSNGYLKI